MILESLGGSINFKPYATALAFFASWVCINSCWAIATFMQSSRITSMQLQHQCSSKQQIVLKSSVGFEARMVGCSGIFPAVCF